jgi:hypothetical protein
MTRHTVAGYDVDSEETDSQNNQHVAPCRIQARSHKGIFWRGHLESVAF